MPWRARSPLSDKHLIEEEDKRSIATEMGRKLEQDALSLCVIVKGFIANTPQKINK